MLTKNEIRGIIISVILLIGILAGFYFIHMMTMDSWREMNMDLSMRMAEAGKRLVTAVIRKITTGELSI